MAIVTVRAAGEPDRFIASAGEFEFSVERGDHSMPQSIELVLLGLGACTIATVSHYMQRKELPTAGLSVDVSGTLDEANNRYGDFQITLNLDDSITPDQGKVILGVAKTCRIHKTLLAGPEIGIELGVGTGGVTQTDGTHGTVLRDPPARRGARGDAGAS